MPSFISQRVAYLTSGPVSHVWMESSNGVEKRRLILTISHGLLLVLPGQSSSLSSNERKRGESRRLW